MSTRDAVVNRILELCRQQNFTINGIANYAAISQSTLKSIINGESNAPTVLTIKKLCDGFGITLGEFFSTPEFDNLEQEIK